MGISKEMHIKNRKTKQELNKDRQEKKMGGGMIMITTEVRKEKNR